MACGIYKFENKINHMVYIGLTIDLKQRYNKHRLNINDKQHQEDLYKAFREFGWDNFDYEVLEEFDFYNADQLSQLEDYYIQKYDSLAPNGYNMIRGGYNGAGLSKGKPVEQYDLEGNFIAEYESTHEAARKTNINFSSIAASARGDIIQIKGFQWKYKDSNKEIKKIPKKYISQIIYQFSLDGELIAEYENLEQAYQKTKIRKSLICLSCFKPTRTAGGYHWSYLQDYKIPTQTLYGQNKKIIKQLDKNNNLIAEYTSLTEAAKITGINLGNISSVCAGKRKTAGGFIWQYG